jgi:hypothetical protein
MRLQEEHPQNPTEQIVMDILLQAGHTEEEIQFRGDSDYRYLRYGYWRNIDVPEDSEIWKWIAYQSLWDDDCGHLHMFPIKSQN